MAKGTKRKNRDRDKEEEKVADGVEQLSHREVEEKDKDNRNVEGGVEEKILDEIPIVEFAGIPVQPAKQDTKRRVTFILERASLEVAKVGKALLTVLDSPLNKAGRLHSLYVQTERNVLIQISPQIRIPRTFKRFNNLMLQLLQKLSVRASNGPDKVLRTVKNPVTNYLPANCRRIGLSRSAPRVVNLRDYVNAASDDEHLVFVVGAMAHGKINVDYIDDFISVSEFPLSAACCIGRICNAVEQKWKIL
ncbi:Ribosomal RNA small subunit methyltransferase [Nymphaea thermarum]|nr:Ribosomal RNA small subunit methyltransferase [Nymphaea thermarum]